MASFLRSHCLIGNTLPSSGIVHCKRAEGITMQIEIGFDIEFECPQRTPMMMMLNVHPSRVPDLVRPDYIWTEPDLPISVYINGFGNRCSRAVLPAGQTRLWAKTVIEDPGVPDPI